MHKYPKNKYGAKKSTHPEWGKFDSKGEMERFGFLKLMEQSGYLKDLRRQVSYPIVVNGQKICRYVADFVYTVNGEEVVEDFKGFLTREAALKLKMIKAVYGFDVKLTKKTNEWG